MDEAAGRVVDASAALMPAPTPAARPPPGAAELPTRSSVRLGGTVNEGGVVRVQVSYIKHIRAELTFMHTSHNKLIRENY